MPDMDKFEEAGAAIAASSPEVETLKALATEVASLEANVAQLNEMLKSANTRLHHIKTKELPDAMARMGSGVWENEEKNFKVEIKDYVSGSLPKLEVDNGEARQKALDLLHEYGADDLVKTEIDLIFGKSEHNIALDLIGRLTQEGFAPNVKSGVHAGTLQAFVRERLKKGENVDLETLGMYGGRYAQITINGVKTKKPGGSGDA